MATKKKTAAVAAVSSTPDMALLAAIGSATAGAGYLNTAPRASLESLGDLVEIADDPQYAKDGDLNFPAVRISTKGTELLATQPETKTQMTETTATAAVATPEVAKASFAIAKFDLPDAPKRVGGSGGARPETYPFSKLEIGDAFFIAATDKVPDPAKKYASTVASAKQRYSVDDTSKPQAPNRKGRMVYPQVLQRNFAIRPVEDGAAFGFPGVKGAAVGRIPVPAAPAAA